MSTEQARDPRKTEPQPLFPQQQRDAPVSEAELQPRAHVNFARLTCERYFRGNART